MQEKTDLVTENNTQPTNPTIKAMSFTDILDGMFTLYRKHFRLFMGVAIVYLVLEFARQHITALLGIDSSIGDSLVLLFYSGIIQFLITVLVSASLAYTSALVYLEREVTVGLAYKQTINRFFSYLGSMVLWFLAVGVLFITIIGIPFSIYLGVRWFLYSIPVLFEELSATKGLARSSELVKGSWWRVFGIALAIFLITFMIAFIFQTIVQLIITSIFEIEETPPQTIQEFIKTIVTPSIIENGWAAFSIQSFVTLGISAILMPIGVIGTTLLYFDMRIRKEAYDIELQATG